MIERDWAWLAYTKRVLEQFPAWFSVFQRDWVLDLLWAHVVQSDSICAGAMARTKKQALDEHAANEASSQAASQAAC